MTDNNAAGSASSPNPFNNDTLAPAAVAIPTIPSTAQQVTPDSIPQRTPEPEQPSDPRVAGLKAMFPDYDDLVLLSVLESVGGNQDSAIDMLLAMSDPNYKSETPAAAQQAMQHRPSLTQEELDEQFARSLVMQEEQERQAWLHVNQGNQRPPTVYQSGHPHQSWGPPGQAASPQSTQADKTMQDIQEQFTKIAETGKKTLGTIFSKVKAKIQEFDQGRPIPSSSNPEASHSWTPSGAPPVASNAAYYDPNPTPPPQRTTIAASPPRTSPPVTTTTTTRGYDLGNDSPSPVISPTLASSSTPAVKAENPPPTERAASASPSPPPATVSGAPFDAARFGLLPKKPISLLPQSPAASGNVSSSGYDSDDDLEYAENPFDDDSPGSSTPAVQTAKK